MQVIGSKTYMWLYKNQSCDNQIILFDYQKTRSSSCPKKFLEGFSGYLQTDGYNGYNKVENTLPKSSLDKELEYAKELLPNMYFILEDGHLEIDNNAAERYLVYLFDKMRGIDDFSIYTLTVTNNSFV